MTWQVGCMESDGEAGGFTSEEARWHHPITGSPFGVFVNYPQLSASDILTLFSRYKFYSRRE